MAQRIKGQEVNIGVLVDGVPQTIVSDVRNFELTPKFTKLEEQYLGQPTKQYDELFDGVDFKMDLHFEDAGVIDFIQTVKARAQNQTPGVTINITAKLNFPNSTIKPVIILQNCFFENMPIEFGSRSEYGQFTISGSCQNFTRI